VALTYLYHFTFIRTVQHCPASLNARVGD